MLNPYSSIMISHINYNGTFTHPRCFDATNIWLLDQSQVMPRFRVAEDFLKRGKTTAN
jgi:hypothetical protein